MKQSRNTDAQVRIRCDEKTFTRECYEAWRDGCGCLACRCVDLYEQGRMDGFLFDARMKILFAHETTQGRHGDGVTLGQLELFTTPRGTASSAIRRAPDPTTRSRSP